jgi:hypothetical protein
MVSPRCCQASKGEAGYLVSKKKKKKKMFLGHKIQHGPNITGIEVDNHEMISNLWERKWVMALHFLLYSLLLL